MSTLFTPRLSEIDVEPVLVDTIDDVMQLCGGDDAADDGMFDDEDVPCCRGGRTEVVIDPNQIGLNVDEVVAVIANQPDMYVRGGELVHLLPPTVDEVPVRDPQAAPVPHEIKKERSPTLRALEESLLTEHLTRIIDFQRVKLTLTKEGMVKELVASSPPRPVVMAIVAAGDRAGIRPLIGVAQHPVMRADGTVAYGPGYDRASGFYVHDCVDVPTIPDRPTREDARVAAQTLMDLVAEFPFVDPSGSAAWLAAVLTVVGRPAINGPTPMFLFDASTRGSGKSLLTFMIGHITTGRVPSVSPWTKNDDEMRKRITSSLRDGSEIELLDNIVGELGGQAIDALLTATSWSDRMLGSNKMYRDLPIKSVFLGSGNNVTFCGDAIRRVIPCRLEPLMERPEMRTGFRIADLPAYVAEHRGELLAAALTILRAHAVAGRPTAELTKMAYPEWDCVVRQAVYWAAGLDPAAGREALYETDPEEAATAALVTGWRALTPTGEHLTVTQAMKRLKADPTCAPGLYDSLAAMANSPSSDLPTPKLVAKRLSSLRGRVVAGLKMDSAYDKHSKVMKWAAIEVTTPHIAAATTPISQATGGDKAAPARTPLRRRSPSVLNLNH